MAEELVGQDSGVWGRIHDLELVGWRPRLWAVGTALAVVALSYIVPDFSEWVLMVAFPLLAFMHFKTLYSQHRKKHASKQHAAE